MTEDQAIKRAEYLIAGALVLSPSLRAVLVDELSQRAPFIGSPLRLINSYEARRVIRVILDGEDKLEGILLKSKVKPWHIEKMVDAISDNPKEVIKDALKVLIEKEVKRRITEALKEGDFDKVSTILATYSRNGKAERTFEKLVKSVEKERIFGVEVPYGSVIILAGETGIGKTTVALNEALRYKHKVYYFSFEMPWEQIYRWLIGIERGISRSDIEWDDATKETFEILKARIEVIDYLRASPYSVFNRMLSFPEKSMVVIDHFQLLRTFGDDSWGLSKASSLFKEASIRQNLITIVISQFNRGEGWGLNRLKGTSSLEQDADVVFFVFRKRDENILRLYCKKNRHGGLKVTEYDFDIESGRLEEKDEQRF